MFSASDWWVDLQTCSRLLHLYSLVAVTVFFSSLTLPPCFVFCFISSFCLIWFCVGKTRCTIYRSWLPHLCGGRWKCRFSRLVGINLGSQYSLFQFSSVILNGQNLTWTPSCATFNSCIHYTVQQCNYWKWQPATYCRADYKLYMVFLLSTFFEESSTFSSERSCCHSFSCCWWPGCLFETFNHALPDFHHAHSP